MEILARAVGRRKEAVAQVQIIRGTGKFLINDKEAIEYLQHNSCSLISVKAPLNCLTQLDGDKTDYSFANHEVPHDERSSPQRKLPQLSSPNTRFGVPQSQTTYFLKQLENMDTIVKVKGGGLIGQAEAVKLAVARALCLVKELSLLMPSNQIEDEALNEPVSSFDIRKPLKSKGYLTIDSRVKERRKYGLKKARKASQYHKR
uniref:Small ribosomal subunit protein uS9c n=1 Tax=Borodinellopsis insignis TaxID=3229915 RepID=A0AB39U420_9CHLO